MDCNLLKVFPYLMGDEARQVFEDNNVNEARGFFETEDAFVAYEKNNGVTTSHNFLRDWQARAFAATDLDDDYIWSLTGKEFIPAFQKALDIYYTNMV